MSKARLGSAILAALVGVALAAPALATNGMYLTAYGSEASGRAGANVAIADRALGLQTNPAGIGQLQGQHVSVDVQWLAPQLSYAGDPFGNAFEGKDLIFTMPSISYVRGQMESPWTWGLGLVSQGGMGATFEGYRTPFGTTDGTFSEVRFFSAMPTVSYGVTDDLSFGASTNFGYSDLKFRFYPNTSFYSDNGTPTDPADDMGFFGADLTDRAKAFTFSARLGVMWRMNEQVQFGAVYQSETQGDFENGTLQMDMTALGLGPVRYDATVDGFTWPDQIGIGVELRPVNRWIVAADVKRYGWSKAIELIEVKGTNPNKPGPFSEVLMPFTFDWDDQWVYTIVPDIRATDAVTLRGGYDYGKSPVPDETLNPLFPATTQNHAALGLGYTWLGNTFNIAVERAFEASQTNANPDQNVNPFGPGASVDHSQWTVSVGFSKAFSGK